MQKQTIQIFKYPLEVQQYRQQYLKPVSVQQFKKIDDHRIERQFKILSSASLLSQDLICTIPTNMNRYQNILTYQHNRVKIPQIPNYYVNASLMKSIVDGTQFVIFCQAPVPNFENFWQAVYYKEVSIIVMLCMFQDPKRGHQAHIYWPSINQSIKFHGSGQITVTNVQEKQLDKHFKKSKFILKGSEGEKTVTHYHWTGWSDMKAPVGDTLHIMQQLVQILIKQVDEQKPVVIHCSAGVGRTGTLAAIVQAKRCVRQKKNLSVFSIIQNFRKHRYGCIQTFEQYRFIYKFLQKEL